MKRYSRLILAVAAILCAAACGKDPKADNEGEKGEQEEQEESYEGLTPISFTETTARLANPERGWYSGKTIGPGDKAISASTLKTWRKTGKTICLYEVELDDFVKKDIDASFLELIQKDFDALREAGLKCVLRFGYSWDYRASGVTADEKPYDATPEQCLRHVAQVKPLLQKNGDVIMCLQAGFVGIWGEWYYTDNFEDAGSAKFTGRKALVEALLDAMPQNRQVQMRTGNYKVKALGVTFADTLSDANAFKPTPLARLGFHNDCFLADGSDKGTWGSKAEKAYMVNASAYTIMGGETCELHSTYCKCDNSLKAMADQHWTYLHDGYRQEVLEGWKTGKCYTEITDRLGYRLVLDKAFVPEKATAGQDVRIVLKIRNDGFAPPMNPRGAEIILKGSGTPTVITLDDDPRFWKAGEVHTVDVSFKAPAAGSYDVCLNLPDPEETLKTNPAYSIRLANEDVWDEATGYNKIFKLTVE